MSPGKTLSIATVMSTFLLSACASGPTSKGARNAGIESAAKTHDAISEDNWKAGNDANSQYHADKAKEERKKLNIQCQRGRCKT